MREDIDFLEQDICIFNEEPEDYAEFDKRYSKAITRKDLGNKIQFTSIRAFEMDEECRIKDINRELDLYTKKFRLGDILGLFYKTIYAKNFRELVDEVKARGLYIFDIWGYVPGSFSDKFSWGEYKVPGEALEYLRETLGNHFLGFDCGEQDGRYIGAYTSMMCPTNDDRVKQYLNFQRHFEMLGNHMQNQMVAICSMNFCHYFAKEGNVIMLGAETAQALINTNLWYAYLRGAGKQYGLLWLGNASIWNRWGYKDYERQGFENGYEYGPDSGTSLSLLRRLLYVEYMYNCDVLGFENGHVVPEKNENSGNVLSPIGQIQADGVRFIEENGYAGVMYTPVAILMDFFNGWTPPRHLYTHEYYKVWGNLPYEEGDYQTHALFSLIFPGYENSGFFRDERGFLTPTPYGDMADIIFSDTDKRILSSYNTVILSGRIELDMELYEKLRYFVEKGGHLIVSASHIVSSKLPQKYMENVLSFLGIRNFGEKHKYSAHETILFNGMEIVENTFEMYDILPEEGAEIIAKLYSNGLPLIMRKSHGKGKVSLIASPYGINSEKLCECIPKERETKYLVGEDIVTEKILTAVDNIDGKNIPMFYDYLSVIKQYLGECLNIEKIIDTTNRNLQCIVNVYKDGSLSATIVNNGPSVQRFDFMAKGGELTIIAEMDVTGLPEGARGCYPKYSQNISAVEEGMGELSIKPWDIRIFRLKLDGWKLKNRAIEPSKDDTQGRILALRNISSLKTEMLANPTFKQHFCGVKLDASYIMEKDAEWLRKEAEFIKRHKVDVIVDFSSMLNHYPQMSLLDNVKERYEENKKAIAEVFKKSALFGCRKVVFMLHRNAENHITPADAIDTFERSIKNICSEAEKYSITVYLQNGTKGRMLKTTEETVEFIDRLNTANLKFAYNICHSLTLREEPFDILKKYHEKINGVMISAPECDDYGQYSDSHSPVFESQYSEVVKEFMVELRREHSSDFICQDAIYKDWNEVYLDRILF